MIKAEEELLNGDGNPLTIAQLGARAADPVKVAAGEKYLVEDGNGSKSLIEVDPLPEFALTTSAKRTVTSAGGFSEYVNRHGGKQTEIWADQPGNTVVAVIDANASAEAGIDERFGYERHRVSLKLEHTPGWIAWVKGQGQGPQDRLAEHIEEWAENVFSPSGAEMLEIAQTLQGSRNANFTSGSRLSNGEVNLAYTEELKGAAGKSGNLSIPEEFELGLVPYVGGNAYRVVAKFRWRLDGGRVSVGYKLIGLERILEEAFKDVMNEISEATEFPVFAGRP